jgi:NADH-quinone oxidoreductase subunit L
MTRDAGTLSLIALLLPALAFLVLAVAVPLRRSGRPAAYFSILSMACSLVAAILATYVASGFNQAESRLLWDWLPGEGRVLATIGVFADAGSTMMLVLVALVALLVQVYSLGYLSEEAPAGLGRYYTYQSLFAFSMMGLVLAPNFVQLFICWELVGLCSYLLIGFWYQRPSAARAAVKAFWVTKAGDVGLLIGIVLLWQHAGTFDFVELRGLAESGILPLAGLSIITFCIYLSAVGKSAQFPLHVWLPDAMEGPTPVSALIHAATMVTAGVYLLYRTDWLFALTPEVLVLVAWVGAFTALLAAVLACVQDDIKRVLAYSTVSQLGYMMVAIGSGFAVAGFFHLLTHGLFKALLFLGAGAVIHAVHGNDLSRMGGLARVMPQTALVFGVGALSLAGVPFFAGFVSKEEILRVTWAGGLAGPFVLLMIVAFLTAFYMFRATFLAFFGTPAAGLRASRSVGAALASPGSSGEHERTAHPHDPPATMLWPLWVLATLSVAAGVYSTLVGRIPVLGPVEPEAVPGWLMAAAIGATAAGILLAWLMYQRRAVAPDRMALMLAPVYRAALARFWIDDVFEAVYRGAVLGSSRAIGWVDRYLVDGVLNVLSAQTLTVADVLRRMQTGRAQDYVYAVAIGLLVLVFWMRWI